MKKKFKLFCFGFGQVAKYFVQKLLKNNYNFDLVTTNTTKTKLKEFKGITYKSYYFLNNKFDKDLLFELDSSNKILVSIPPINKIDFVWVRKEDRWGPAYENYKIFKKEYGREPRQNSRDKSERFLGSWTSKQRVSFNKNELSRKRIEKLNSIGFILRGKK